MERDEKDDGRLDERLKALLFPPSAPADPRRTEAFVARVMSRVREESPAPWERWLWRLGAPVFAAGLAALLVSLTLPADDADEPLDAQLLTASAPAADLPALDDASFLRVAP